jgi:hypothetical protein
MARSKRTVSDPQVARFVEMARALDCDEDKDRFEAQLGGIARHKPTKSETKSPPVSRPQRPAR